jgi:site-specific recombinase XerD
MLVTSTEDGASASEIRHLLGHESLATSQLYIDSTANEQRLAARANRTYQVLEKVTKASPSPTTKPRLASALTGLERLGGPPTGYLLEAMIEAWQNP